MKQLTILFLLFSINVDCDQTIEKEQVLRSVTYSAMTRGSSYSCSIDSKSITVESNGELTQNKTVNIKLIDWKNLQKIVNDISLNAIGNFMSTTNNSTHDRVRIATLVIEADGEVYESESFDEGNPPSELKPLIDLMLTLAETVE